MVTKVKRYGRGKAKKTSKGMIYTCTTKTGFKGRKKKRGK